MPQLRDSSTRAMHADTGMRNDFGRIFGIETEYGVSVTGADHAVDAGQVAMTMFQPVVSKARSTNTYLTNGSRLYLDVGSHPEYATAEALDPKDALLARIWQGSALCGIWPAGRSSVCVPAMVDRATIHVFKNNVDSAGHAFGCHENYLVRRFIKLELIQAISCCPSSSPGSCIRGPAGSPSRAFRSRNAPISLMRLSRPPRRVHVR